MFKKLLQLLKIGGNSIFDLPIFAKIRGYKTIILSIITIATGLVVYFADSLNGAFAKQACDAGLTFLCNFEGSKFYGSLLVIIGFLNKILRLVTDIPVPGTESIGKLKK